MDISLLWTVSDLTNRLCAVTTQLQDDPAYTKEAAVQELLDILEFVNETLYNRAIT